MVSSVDVIYAALALLSAVFDRDPARGLFALPEHFGPSASRSSRILLPISRASTAASSGGNDSNSSHSSRSVPLFVSFS